MRNVVLSLLVGQTVLIVLLMRYSRTVERSAAAGPMYKPSVAVFLAELFKLPLCLAMIAYETRGAALAEVLHEELLGAKRADTLKCCVPALCYTVQNNLLFLSLSHLDAPTYQICYQMKTLTTAGFAYLLLSKWLAVGLLVAGTVLVSDVQAAPREAAAASSRAVGLAAVLVAATLSGFSAAFLEALLKKPSVAGLWMRNVQLGLFALPIAAATMAWQDGAFVAEYGLLQGFGAVEWAIVLVNGMGGLLIAATMKYADAVVKCFANALAIILGGVVAVPMFELRLGRSFLLGGACTVVASSLYAWAPNWSLPALLRERRSLATETSSTEGHAEFTHKPSTATSTEMQPLVAACDEIDDEDEVEVSMNADGKRE